MATRRRGEAPRRRSSDEAREAILDATERLLREVGPGGVRLQEVAKAVGVSHPTVLHHFGSREALIGAVVERAMASLKASLIEAVADADDAEDTTALLEAAAKRLRESGRARTFLWLTLGGYGPGLAGLHVKPLAEAVHAERKERWAGRKVPPFEDTYFTVLLPTLALVSLAVLEESSRAEVDATRFRAWLAKLVHQRLEEG